MGVPDPVIDVAVGPADVLTGITRVLVFNGFHTKFLIIMIYAYGMPIAVSALLQVSGTTAALALSWDQLVSGPRRTKMARMEAMINSKLDTQERLSRRRDEAEADIRAR